MSEVLDLEKQLQKDVNNIKNMAEDAGLDFYPVDFELITKRAMIEFGTYALPNRYSHWTFGKSYGRLKNLSNLGVLEILEMVLNSNPAHAFLLDSNTLVEHRMVIAHVFAHVDFFKHNYWFSKTNRNMLSESKFHERRIKELELEFGKDAVEEFLDVCISLQWHVDFYKVFKPDEKITKVISSADRNRFLFRSEDLENLTDEADDSCNEHCENCKHSGEGGEGPQNVISVSGSETYGQHQGPQQGSGNGSSDGTAQKKLDDTIPKPAEGYEEKDLLKFLMREAPIAGWQKEILQIVHDEIIYFIPTSLTKIMNEGWATYWHVKLCGEYLDFEDFQRFAVKHSELMSSKGLNPYKVGYMIYNDVVRRWDEKEGEGAGLKKIFEIREFEDDISFIRNYLTQEICDECGMFLFEQDKKTGEMVIKSTDVEDIKDSIITEIINFGKPVIVVKDANYNNDREMYMLHKYDGRELDMEYAVDVMKALFKVWDKPIHLETIYSGKRTLVTYNGDKPNMQNL